MAIHPMLKQSNQLITLTGARNTGKTLLAYTYPEPKDMGGLFACDTENSANAVIAGMAENGIAPGYYLNLSDRFDNLPSEDDLLSRINDGKLPWVDTQGRSGLIEMYEFLVETIDRELTPGKYHTFVFDTIEKLEASMAAWVEANKKKSGVTSIAYGKLWTDGVYPLYENLLASIYGRGVKTIIFTSHLKTPWEGNRPVVGKVIPSGKKILYFLSKLMIWLVKEPNNEDGAPAGIIMKERMPSMTIGEDGRWVIKRQLPRRLPRATWQQIEWYLENGCDLKNPAPGEALSAEEAEMVSDMITDKQMELMLLDAKKALQDAQNADNMSAFGSGETVEIPQIDFTTKNIRDAAEKLRSETGVEPKAVDVKAEIERQLGGAEVSLAQVIKALKQ